MELDERRARVRAEIATRIAALYDPDRYGNRVNHQIDAGPNILGAELAAASLRAPIRNLGIIIDVEPQQISHAATDKQSGDQVDSSRDDGIDDPFAD